MELYRFRPNLPYTIDELQNNYLFFALPDELNDPMEGFLNVYWEGDIVLWKNFLKHYLYTLIYTIINASIEPETIKRSLKIYFDESKYPTKELKELFDIIRDIFFGNKEINELVDYLISLKHKVYIQEIEHYLFFIYFRTLYLILNELKKHISLDWNMPKTIDELGYFKQMKSLMPSIEAQYPDAIKVFFMASQCIEKELKLVHKFNIDSKDKDGLKKFFLVDFPSRYIDEIKKLLFSTPCVTCFMENYNSPTHWGYYSSGHRGLCLIFDDKKGNEEVQFKFSSGSVMSMTTQKVKYQKQYPKINFFEMMGSLPLTVIEKSWLMDWEGNQSACLRIGENFLTDKWRKEYLKNLSEVFTIKLSDWEKEKEHRIVLQKEFVAGDSIESRKFVYDFGLLKGIIFGLKAEDSFKINVIKIITKKCEEFGRKDFKFYQATYNEKTGLIDKIEIRL